MIQQELRIVRDAFWSPTQAVQTAAAAKHLWGVQALVLAMLALSTALASRFMFDVATNTLPRLNRDASAASLASVMTIGGYFSLAFAVIMQVAFWHITAATLQVLNILMNSTELNYRKYLSLAVVGSIYSNLAPFHYLVVWYARGVESFSSVRETAVPIGLNLLPIEMSPSISSLLGSFNVYQACSVAYVAYGFATLTGLRKTLSFVILGGFWVLWQCIVAALGLAG